MFHEKSGAGLVKHGKHQVKQSCTYCFSTGLLRAFTLPIKWPPNIWVCLGSMMGLDVLTCIGGWQMSRCAWVRGPVALKPEGPPLVGLLMWSGLRSSIQGSAVALLMGQSSGVDFTFCGSRKTSEGWIQWSLVPLHLRTRTVLCWGGGSHSREGRRVSVPCNRNAEAYSHGSFWFLLWRKGEKAIPCIQIGLDLPPTV